MSQLDRIEALLKRLLIQTAPKKPAKDGKVFKPMKDKYWSGPDYSGSRFSECPPDFLRAFAKYKGACVWAAEKEYEETKKEDAIKYVPGNKADAALAEAWAEYHEAAGTDVAADLPAQQEFNGACAGDDAPPF